MTLLLGVVGVAVFTALLVFGLIAVFDRRTWRALRPVRSRSLDEVEQAWLGDQFGSRFPADRHPELATDKFEASTYCPGCGRYDTHGMREPKPAPTSADLYGWEFRRKRAIERGGIETVTIASWGSVTPARKVEIIPGFNEPKPIDTESMWATIRQCECGHEWGQK